MCGSCCSRREFFGLSASLAASTALLRTSPAVAAAPPWHDDSWDPDRPLLDLGRPLRVQPVLMYATPQPRPMASYKSWGGVQTEEAAAEEAGRIAQELAALAARAEFALEVLPVARVATEEQAAGVAPDESDVTVLYPATGRGPLLTACIPDRGAILFARRRSGPFYYWYQALSERYLATDKDGPEAGKPASVHDVVIDDQDELLLRLRAWYALTNFLGSRVVALGGAWGKYAPEAPQFARERFGLDIVEISYDDLARRIEAVFSDAGKMACAERWTDRFLAMPETRLETDRPFVVNAFALYGIFKDYLAEYEATAFTISGCMGTILPMSKTTACLSLGLLGDEGYAAFCESDFVVVPAGMFLRHLAGKPVFMHNSTFPHAGGLVTCAHCSAPRRMNGERYEPVRVLTHYESEFGAAPKVEIPVGQEVSFINPEYATGRWLGHKGVVEANPFYEICRSQQDVRIRGDWKKLLHEVRDSHWMMVYGDYLEEIGYAAPRLGITWEDISEA